jgi:hypothetical protein
VVVVTDGAIADTLDLPADLRRRPRIIVLPRVPFSDAYVAAVDGPRRVSAADTIRLRVAYGAAGPARRSRRAARRSPCPPERSGSPPARWRLRQRSAHHQVAFRGAASRRLVRARGAPRKRGRRRAADDARESPST